MKHILRLLCLCGLLCSVVPQSLALPPGSYLRSCQRCSVAAGRLSCACYTKRRRLIWSVLPSANYCRHARNVNGLLRCLPEGSYIATCRQCRWRGNRLSCQCLNRARRWRWTSLYRLHRCRHIVNANGYLRCMPRPQHRWVLPRGSYLRTCRQCRFDGHRLACRCQRRDRTWRHSVLRGANRCSRVINRNGRLRCQR